ncbi:MAG TPA: AbrB/MazE/SpoVT family DNA-binding domain-containing protein [Acidimicrobiales bacterium]|nr:AbrB/MazE/SpoVT family DNA-binding domain-containing protein [Acidimicrobiales bacterium]
MNSTGVPRRIDHLGRIVVPVELRRMLGISPGDELEVAVKGDSVTLTKVRQGCVFCGTEDDLRSFRERLICRECTTGVSEVGPSFSAGSP